MASQVPREHIYGNWKPTVTERAKAKRMAPKVKREKRPGNSEAHLAAIRTLPCCIPGCQIVGCDPHHSKVGPAAAERSVGRRASDRWCVSLCRKHHDEVEAVGSRREAGWFLERGIEVIELAAALWAVSPDKGAMARIILAHKSPLPYCSKGKMK